MKNSEYQDQARAFLNECNAQMSISFSGYARPGWDEKEHACYTCIIKTQRGSMTVMFYDSLANTEKRKITPAEYIEKYFNCSREHANYSMKVKALKAVEDLRKEAHPTEYDILACLQKYDVGSMDDFLSDFGYEIKSVKDMTNFINTYNAVVKEWQDICRCFTPDQIEKMQEIN